MPGRGRAEGTERGGDLVGGELKIMPGWRVGDYNNSYGKDLNDWLEKKIEVTGVAKRGHSGKEREIRQLRGASKRNRSKYQMHSKRDFNYTQDGGK